MTWGIFKADGVSEAYKKMKSCATEELKGNQHKLDVNKNGKVDGDDLAKLRATKEEVEQIDELSIGAIKNYIKKAKQSKKFEADTQATAMRKNDHMMASDAAHAVAKRKEGIKAAKAKLNKEDTEAELAEKIILDKDGNKIGGGTVFDTLKNKPINFKPKTNDKEKEPVKEELEELEDLINEVLSADQPAGKWIQDFVKSDDPKFAGDSKKQRIKRALGAWYSAKRNESTDYDFFVQYIDLSEEAEVVKTGAKEIKHDNMKEKQATRDEMETHSGTEQAFVDAHSIKDEEEPAKKAGNDQSGKEKVGKAAEPKGQGPAKYDGDSKLSDKDKAKVTAEAVIKTEAGEEIDTEPKEKKKAPSKM